VWAWSPASLAFAVGCRSRCRRPVRVSALGVAVGVVWALVSVVRIVTLVVGVGVSRRWCRRLEVTGRRWSALESPASVWSVFYVCRVAKGVGVGVASALASASV
jgi:hypothetical protein